MCVPNAVRFCISEASHEFTYILGKCVIGKIVAPKGRYRHWYIIRQLLHQDSLAHLCVKFWYQAPFLRITTSRFCTLQPTYCLVHSLDHTERFLRNREICIKSCGSNWAHVVSMTVPRSPFGHFFLCTVHFLASLVGGLQVTLCWRMLYYFSDRVSVPLLKPHVFLSLCMDSKGSIHWPHTVHWNRTPETASVHSHIVSQLLNKQKGLPPSVLAQILSRNPAERNWARRLKGKGKGRSRMFPPF